MLGAVRRKISTLALGHKSVLTLQLKDLGYKPFTQREGRADVTMGSVSVEQGEMNSVSLDIGEGPSLGGKDAKTWEAKLENRALPRAAAVFSSAGKSSRGARRGCAQSCLDPCDCRRHTLLVCMTYLFYTCNNP